MENLFKLKNFFNSCIKYARNVMSESERGIILILFKKNYCLSPDIYLFCQIFLGKIESGTEFFNPVIHF